MMIYIVQVFDLMGEEVSCKEFLNRGDANEYAARYRARGFSCSITEFLPKEADQ